MEVFSSDGSLLQSILGVFRLLALIVVLPVLILIPPTVVILSVIRMIFAAGLLASEMGLWWITTLEQKIIHAAHGTAPIAQKLLPAAEDPTFTLNDELEVVSNINALIEEIGEQREEEAVLERVDAVMFLLNVLYNNGAAEFEDLKDSTILKMKEAAPHVQIDIGKL